MIRGLLLTLLLATSPTAAAEPMPRLRGNTFIHDPSVIVDTGGWASFATGVERASDGGMPRTKTSPDGITWTEAGAIPGGMPDWVEDELGFVPLNIWAPSVTVSGGLAYLYYSVSSFGRNDSAIGLMTNDAFDVRRPAAGWVDDGMVLRSRAGDDFNAIDPFRIDTGGRAYLAFGSFWGGIRLVELDPRSGRLLDGAVATPIASRGGGAIEAPAILEHDGRFYLFVSFDHCCRGPVSTYRIMVGRAEAVTGPYRDRQGKPLLEGGGTELLASSGRYRGPGGQEVFSVDGEAWIAFHNYDRHNGGAPRLQLAPIGWSADGWPEFGALP